MSSIIRTSTILDNLTGGLEAGSIILIYGPTGCGKTTLCLKIAENVAKSGDYGAIYIDTEGGAVKVGGVRMIRVKDLRGQGEALKNLKKEGLSRTMIFVDSMTAAYHRRVLSAPAQFRAGVAADLGGVIARQLEVIRDMVEGTENIAILTAHLKSPVEYHFKMNMLRKMAKAWKEGKYVPTAGDYMNIFTEDPVKWIGGRALGTHVHRRLRIFVDEDGSRILCLDKWPLRPNLCIKYVMDKSGNISTVGDIFTLQDQMKKKLYSVEFKTILSEALDVMEKEGVEVGEEAGEAPAKPEKKQEEKQRKQKPKPGELKFPRVPTLGDIAEKEKSKGETDESSDSDSHGEGAGGRQE